jgi:hypothetical protein
MPNFHGSERWALATAVFVACLTLTTAQAAAQDARTPENQSACLRAANSLQGDPHSDHDLWSIAATCGAGGGQALADAFRASRSVSDAAEQETIEAALISIRDASVFQAARDVAANGSASPSIRALALRVLVAQHNSAISIVSAAGGANCHTIAITDANQVEGAALPSDYAALAYGTARTIAANGTAPADVRATAACVARLLDAFVPRAVNPAVLALTYVCGNRFVVHNANSEWADVTYEVAGSDDSGDFSVPPNGERAFVADVAGLTRIYFNPGHDQPRGVLVTTVANLATSCGLGG